MNDDDRCQLVVAFFPILSYPFTRSTNQPCPVAIVVANTRQSSLVSVETFIPERAPTNKQSWLISLIVEKEETEDRPLSVK